MINRQLKHNYEMAKMFENNKGIQSLIGRFSEIFFQLVESENFDPRTVKFAHIVPKGEEDKLVLTLQSAEYLTAPLVEGEVDIKSASYKLVGVVKSFYSSFLTANSSLSGFIDSCPGFCDCIYLIAEYLLERFKGKDITEFSIMNGDNLVGDLVFYIYFK